VSAAAPTVGLLYPGYSAEDDFPQLEEALDHAVRLPLVHTSVGDDVHTVEALLDTGSPGRLAEGAARLADAATLDAAMWACTSGSFTYGWEGAHVQADALAQQLEVPVSSTSIAFVEALRFLGLSKAAVAASYPDELAQHFASFLRHADVDIVQFASHGIYTPPEVGLLTLPQVAEMVRSVDTPEAEVVLVPDTAMHSLLWIRDLEEAVGKPVLTANQVTVWQGLRLAGASLGPIPLLGTLFTHEG